MAAAGIVCAPLNASCARTLEAPRPALTPATRSRYSRQRIRARLQARSLYKLHVGLSPPVGGPPPTLPSPLPGKKWRLAHGVSDTFTCATTIPVHVQRLPHCVWPAATQRITYTRLQDAAHTPTQSRKQVYTPPTCHRALTPVRCHGRTPSFAASRSTRAPCCAS